MLIWTFLMGSRYRPTNQRVCVGHYNLNVCCDDISKNFRHVAWVTCFLPTQSRARAPRFELFFCRCRLERYARGDCSLASIDQRPISGGKADRRTGANRAQPRLVETLFAHQFAIGAL